MSGASEDLAVSRAQLVLMRQELGEHLTRYRYDAGISQDELARALGRTRTLVSKVEHGTRTLPEKLWQIADEVCGAGGELVDEYRVLAATERDYRARWRVHHQAEQRAAGLARAAAARETEPTPGAVDALLGNTGSDGAVRALLGSGQHLATRLTRLVQEMRVMVERMAQVIGRRPAIRLASLMLASLGAAGLDPDEQTRMSRAATGRHQVDGAVVRHLAATLAHYRRLQGTLGPCAVFETVLAQHELVHHLLHGDVAEPWRTQLRVLDSGIATALGRYLIDLGDPGMARAWFAHARTTAHDAANPVSAAYAAAHHSYAARLAGDPRAALGAAADARSLAASTDDHRVKALADSYAAGAYALNGDYDACLVAVDRAHNFLTAASTPASASPAYWLVHPSIDSQFSSHFVLLGRPRQAVDAASTALAGFERSYGTQYAMCEVRLGHALVLAKEIPEAARVLGNAARHAHLYPRHAAELRTVRGLLRPWQDTRSVQELDAQLHAYGLHWQGPAGGRPG